MGSPSIWAFLGLLIVVLAIPTPTPLIWRFLMWMRYQWLVKRLSQSPSVQQQVSEIDITTQAHALAWLRRTYYFLVILCGSGAVSSFQGVITSLFESDTSALAVSLILFGAYCFITFAGWRHVGVIDPAGWRMLHLVLPLFIVLCLGSIWVKAFLHYYLFLSSSPFLALVHDLTIPGIALMGWISLIVLQRTKIAGMDVRADQLLLTLNKKSASDGPTNGLDLERIDKRRGLVIGTAGALMVLAPMLNAFPSDTRASIFTSQLLTPLSYIGFALLIRARRYFQINVDSLLAGDGRPPILFLRSFDDEEKRNHFFASGNALLDFSLETRLSNHFFRFGPFVAIGSPKDTVPQLGAARVRLSDPEWKSRILRWMGEAQLIIMYAGKTEWVTWELRQVLEMKGAMRLILMMPEIKNLRKRIGEVLARVEQLRVVFESSPWETPMSQFDPLTVRSILFRPDGSIIAINSRSLSRDSYHLAALIAHSKLKADDAAAGGPLQVHRVRPPGRKFG